MSALRRRRRTYPRELRERLRRRLPHLFSRGTATLEHSARSRQAPKVEVMNYSLATLGALGPVLGGRSRRKVRERFPALSCYLRLGGAGNMDKRNAKCPTCGTVVPLPRSMADDADPAGGLILTCPQVSGAIRLPRRTRPQQMAGRARLQGLSDRQGPDRGHHHETPPDQYAAATRRVVQCVPGSDNLSTHDRRADQGTVARDHGSHGRES